MYSHVDLHAPNGYNQNGSRSGLIAVCIHTLLFTSLIHLDTIDVQLEITGAQKA